MRGVQHVLYVNCIGALLNILSIECGAGNITFPGSFKKKDYRGHIFPIACPTHLVSTTDLKISLRH